MRTNVLTLTALALGVVGIACFPAGKEVVPPDESAIASIVVTPGSNSLVVGSTVALTAITRNAAGAAVSGHAITWAASPSSVATIGSTSGVLTAVGPGTATVTATSESVTGTATVTVADPPPAPVATVSVNPGSYTLTVGGTVQLSATTRDANGAILSGRAITWSSSNNGYATVSASGLVSAVSPGAVTITASSEGKSGTATVTVNPAPAIPVATVTVAPGSNTLTVGGTVQLTATTRDANGATLTGRAINWSSSNNGYATVSASGLVSAVGAGSVTITATSEGKSGTATVVVNAPPPAPVATVTVAPGSNTLTVGGTVQLTATTRDANGATLTGRTITWSSSNNGYATVSGSGLVSAVGAGTATITATSEGKSGTATVVVNAPPPVPVATVTVAPGSNTLTVGGTVQLTATTRDANGATLTGRTITWSSSNNGYATVSASGLVSAVAAGTATITATSEGKSGTATVVVNAPPPVPVATVTVAPSSSNVTVGGTVQLTATTRDANGATLTGRAIAWSSSNNGYATVSASGLVSAVGAGTATITATSEGKSGTATVVVAAAPPPPPPGSVDPALLSCPAPDIMSHGFDDGTLGPFLDNLNANGKIIRDPTAKGGYSVQQQWFYTPGQEQQSGVDAAFPATQKIYVRWAYKEDATFDNSGIKKVVLPRAPGFGVGSGYLTVYGDRFNFDFLNDQTAHPFGVWTNVGTEVHPSELRGSWHWYEFMNDISTSGALRMKFWIDGVLKMDYTEPLPNGGLTMGAVRIGSTFNAPVANAFDWTDEVAISSQCIKAPW